MFWVHKRNVSGRKSEFEFLRFYCTQNLYVQQTPDLLEKLAESLLYSFIVTHFAKIEDKNVIAKE